MASQQATSRDAGYKRASRKGAPRRFACDHPGCDKMYSRAEHLQRHQLNHNPTEIFQCDVGACDQKFVRLDLLARHKKRHTPAYTPRNRIPSFDVSYDGTMPSRAFHFAPRFHSSTQSQPASIAPHQGRPPSTISSNQPNLEDSSSAFRGTREQGRYCSSQSTSNALRTGRELRIIQHGQRVYGDQPLLSSDACNTTAHAGTAFPVDQQAGSGKFTAWLFDPRSSHDGLTNATFQFLEGGLNSTFDSRMSYDIEATQNMSPMETTSRTPISDLWIPESRRQEIIRWFQIFRTKQPTYEPSMANLTLETGGDLPAISLEMLHNCLGEFWEKASIRLPIVHRHTFSARGCPLFLLLVMISLGAASLHSHDPTSRFSEYGAFGDVIIESVRWEIMTSDDATPPMRLWVAQALLLLEFYEKMYSSRRFHERAHIYHPSFLTLLRRGNPLIGRMGSETPQEHVDPISDGVNRSVMNPRDWWHEWAERESMHRVVFAAFMLDIIHAAMFGHSADMAAHEVRLPLPCDDEQWNATTPDVVRQLDGRCTSGLKPASFPDCLKSALHGRGGTTDSFGRIIVMAGLLSVGWHLSRKEMQYQWMDMQTPPTENHDGWRDMLTCALDKWKEACDAAASTSSVSASASSGAARLWTSCTGPIDSAPVLFHLAHISLRTDIVDCQVYAGAKRLLGRRVSSEDHANAAKRMASWAARASTRHAVLHAFKLLHHVLVEPIPSTSRRPEGPRAVQYSIRDETDPHRPWIVYYAVLTIWAFVQAVGRPAGEGFPLRPSQMGHSTYARMAEYLSWVAHMDELRETDAATLYEGLPELLDVVEGILEEAETELLQEAKERLGVCRDMLLGGFTRC